MLFDAMERIQTACRVGVQLLLVGTEMKRGVFLLKNLRAAHLVVVGAVSILAIILLLFAAGNCLSLDHACHEME